MSILNACVDPAVGTVIVDTHGEVSGDAVSISKLATLNHLPAILAFRGVSTMFSCVQMLSHAVRIDDFECLDENMPDILTGAVNLARGLFPAAAAHAQETLGTVNAPCELVMVGWSKRRGEVVGVRYASDVAGPPWQRDEFAEIVTGPQVSFPANDQGHIELARRQVQMHHDAGFGAMAGGRLWKATVLKDAIDVRSIGEL